MNTAVINIKVESSLKDEVHKIADELGFSLSSLIHAFLKNLAKTKTITFSTVNAEIPNQYFLDSLRESMEDIKNGEVSPTFTNAEDAISWLNDPKRKYENKVK